MKNIIEFVSNFQMMSLKNLIIGIFHIKLNKMTLIGDKNFEDKLRLAIHLLKDNDIFLSKTPKENKRIISLSYNYFKKLFKEDAENLYTKIYNNIDKKLYYSTDEYFPFSEIIDIKEILENEKLFYTILLGRLITSFYLFDDDTTHKITSEYYEIL